MKKLKCECPYDGVLRSGMESWYDPITELPFVNHHPGECGCTNELKRYIRKGKAISLCSNCVMYGDEEE